MTMQKRPSFRVVRGTTVLPESSRWCVIPKDFAQPTVSQDSRNPLPIALGRKHPLTELARLQESRPGSFATPTATFIPQVLSCQARLARANVPPLRR